MVKFINHIDSFNHLSDWTNKFIKEKIDVPIIIVGNKTDQPRVISKSYKKKDLLEIIIIFIAK